MKKYFVNIWSSLNSKIRRFIIFALVGGSGSLISLILLYIFVECLHVNKYAAWLFGLCLGLATNFLLNSLYTFRDRQTHSKQEITKRMIKYYAFYALAVGVNYVFYFLFNSLNFYYLVSAFLAVAIGAVINFYIANFFIWKKT